MNSDLWSLAGTLLFVAFDLFFITMTWYSAREWGRSSLLALHGKCATGTLVTSRVSFNRAASFFVTYQFSRENKKDKKVVCEKEQQVSWRHIERLKNGEQVEVIYLPDNPNISKLTDTHTDNTARDSSTILAVMGIVVVHYIPIVWVGTFLVECFGLPLLQLQSWL